MMVYLVSSKRKNEGYCAMVAFSSRAKAEKKFEAWLDCDDLLELSCDEIEVNNNTAPYSLHLARHNEITGRLERLY